MSRRRKLRIKAVERPEPDLRKLGRALIQLAEARAEADARQEHEQRAAAATRKAAS